MHSDRSSAAVRRLWAQWGQRGTTAAVVAMTLAVIPLVGHAIWRLVLDPSETAAFDLGLRVQVVHGFFAGDPVYKEINFAVYPPASQMLLWPFVGWVDFSVARWLWAGSSLACLLLLSRLLLREMGCEGFWRRAFVALLPLSLYPTAATIANGQLPIHLLPPLLAGCLLLKQQRSTLARDLIVAGLMLVALAKPTLTAPFFWIVLFVPGSLRPATLCVAGYVGLTLLASLIHGQEPVSLLADWYEAARWGVHQGVAKGEAHFSIAELLSNVSGGANSAAYSLAALGLLGAWVWRRRHSDIWILLGVSALAARFWTYHRWYDDLLIILPLVAVLRIAVRDFGNSAQGVVAGVLFLLNLALLAVPGGRYVFAFVGLEPLESVFIAAQLVGWCCLLLLLVCASEPEATSGTPPNGT